MALFPRAHWLPMPAALLEQHLAHKAFLCDVGRKNQASNAMATTAKPNIFESIRTSSKACGFGQ